ncbi:putative late blight resistance proteinR1A-10 [Sesamum angolense]|uniref:Late blight resistance proteinR1A-10 n=1 Tax=Sesamum angolense TaxID=2727404 RepID=A0AAE1XF98_9LAMI|nr:putative late blight resistance proteinR1A-10 [Sesamum angolense]
MIAKSCGGLPLAIAVAAGILTKVDKTQHYWQKIAKNISSVVATSDDQFSNILTLSYDHLPCHLKACFLYMGGFPEDYNIPVSKLTKLWVAEGFLELNEPRSLEELAEENLEDLVKRNLVLNIKRRSNGKIRFCGLHDLLRDLCIRKAQEKEFLHVVNTYVRGIPNHRRLTPLTSFPTEITQLFHLRFLALALAYSELRKSLLVPSSISKLQILQTLMIRVYGWEISDSILFLPFQIWEMPQLRHLIFFQGSMLPTPLAAAPSGGQVLENLQTLCVDNFRFTSNTFEMIPNLKKLKVYYDDASRAKWAKYCLYNLVHLCQLETLNLMFTFILMCEVDPFPASFAFPPKLKKLTLSKCKLPRQGMAVIRLLPNLEVLKLRYIAIIGEEWECSDGEFPRLKFLLMERLNLRSWPVESTHFPCLERLIIKQCLQLEDIPCEIGDIPTLVD